MANPNDYAVTIYTKPNCPKCRFTEGQVRKMGIEPTMPQIYDHPDKVELMEKNGWLALPLVEVTTPEGETMIWNDLNTKNLDALKTAVNA